MFVPEWPSMGEEVQQETVNTEGSDSTQMNGDLSSHDKINNQADNVSPEDTDSNAIELTHNAATGITSVGEEGDDAMDQCAAWTATFSNQDEENGNVNAESAANNVISSFGGGGDIWSTEGFSFESPLKDLLDSNIYSLVDLLEQDELLQELRGCEARLIDYFSKPDVVAGLVECMICEVPYADDERGKELWCKEEKERRAKLVEVKEGNAKMNESLSNESNEEDVDVWPKQSASIVHATTNDVNDEPNIEASWNPPLQTFHSTKPKNETTAENQRTPEEEYDLRYYRYPYMACEVLCSDVGSTLDVLLNGCVEDITIDDDEDSLLNDTIGIGMQQTKSEEQDETYDNIDVYLDEPNNYLSPDSNLQPLQVLDPPPPPTPRNKQTPNRRILDLLFSLLIDTPPSSLDDRRAGYFEKVLVILFRKYSHAMSDYMNTPMIETVRSKEKAQKETPAKEPDATDGEEPAYVSLMPSMDSLANDEDSQTASSTIKPMLSPINTQLPLPEDVAAIHTPPLLMCALFDHLHSHSIMHIIQRLLLPSAARQQQDSREVKDEADTETEKGDPNCAINDRFMNAISEMNNAEDQNHTSNEGDGMGDDDDAENPMNHLFQCDWSEHPIYALELLSSRLEGQTEQPFLIKYKFPVGYDETLLLQGNGSSSSCDSENYDAKLSCAQHASEILIGIIQNSPLDSAVMTTLSSEPFFSRILRLTSFSGSYNETQTLMPYESTMTCAMTVLENLILQLGGYGTATAPAPPNSNSDILLPNTPPPMMQADTSFSLTELGPHTPVASPIIFGANPAIATTSALIHHLPSLLEELSSLLVHPETKTWTIPTQFTNLQPRPILGTVRIRIIRLIESLVLLGDPEADLLLQQSDCLGHCLDLFWEFEWCSMLHQSVANLLVHVFEAGDNRAGLQDYFIIRCGLLEKLMDSFSDRAFPVVKMSVGQDEKVNGEKDESKVSELGDDLVMAMKTMYTNHLTSSVESLDGSDSDNSSKERLVEADDSDAIAHVSEDDIESAMEKEEQENQAMNSSADNNNISIETEINGSAESIEPDVPVQDGQILFRRGYMGHVIIICQALANACTTSSQGNIQVHPTNESNEKELLPGDFMTHNDSLTAEFESTSVHLMSAESPPTKSAKRLDTSPTRIGDEDSPMSPISRSPSSPSEVESLAQSPLESRSVQDSTPIRHITLMIRQHPLYEKWILFVSTTLAKEMSLQTSPLGGQTTVKDPARGIDSEEKNRFVTVIDDEALNNEYMGTDKGVFGIVGDIDMDEADMDLAAEMIESLSLGSSNKEPQHTSQRRRASGGVLIGNEGSTNVVQERNIGNFGSLISSNNFESKGYVYDDPLGCVCRFENEGGSDDDMDFTPKANFSKEESGTRCLNKSSSTDEEDEDDMVPVLDLFTGNFSENFVNENDITTPAEGESTSNNFDDTGWANFANFDDAFALDDVATDTTGTSNKTS